MLNNKNLQACFIALFLRLILEFALSRPKLIQRIDNLIPIDTTCKMPPIFTRPIRQWETCSTTQGGAAYLLFDMQY